MLFINLQKPFFYVFIFCSLAKFTFAQEDDLKISSVQSDWLIAEKSSKQIVKLEARYQIVQMRKGRPSILGQAIALQFSDTIVKFKITNIAPEAKPIAGDLLRFKSYPIIVSTSSNFQVETISGPPGDSLVLRDVAAALIPPEREKKSIIDENQANYLFRGKHSFSKSIISMKKDGILYRTNRLLINDDSLRFTEEMDYAYVLSMKNPDKKIALKDVLFIKTSKGTQTLKYTVYGGVALGLSGLLGAAQAYNNAQNQALIQGKYVTNGDVVIRNVTIGATILGAIIGAAYGSSIHDWLTLYNHGERSSKDTSGAKSYSLKCYAQNNGIVANWGYHF